MMITLYRIDARGASHYYNIHDRQGHLFSPFSFTVSWGKNLSMTREKPFQFSSQPEMDDKVRELLAAKFKAGYRVLYSYFRPREMEKLQPELRKYAAR
jgi:predicted DNA-binding WGR domain protein